MVKELVKVDHTLRGESYVTSRYRNSTGLRALLLSLLDGMGSLEDQIELFQYFLNIYNARGATLDYWGEIYNVPGRPEDDTVYRSIIFSYMSMYRSQGDAASVRDALLAGFIASDCYVWDTDPGKFTAQVYNPTYPVDTQLLQRIVDTATAIGVGTTGVTGIPGQYGYFGFAGENEPQDAIPPFQYWETYNFNSGKYSPEGNGYRIFCSQGVYNSVKLSIVCDDDSFYNELLSTSNTAFKPYSFRFYAGTLGTVNNRIYAGGSSNKYLRFEMPIGESTTAFEEELKNTFGTGTGTNLGTLTITDRDGHVFKLTPVVQNSGVVTGQNRTSDGVTYRRISIFPFKNDTIHIQVEKDGVVIPSENITQFSSFTRIQESLYFISNPNNLLTNVSQDNLGEPVYFEDRNGHTWGIGAGAVVTTSQLGNDEWELVDLELSSQLPALTEELTYLISIELGKDVTALGAYDDGELGAGIVFTLENNTSGQTVLSELESMQYLEYITPDNKPVRILTPGSTIGLESEVVSTTDRIVAKLKLFEGSGERVAGRVCYGDIANPDGYENAKSLYLADIDSALIFDQNNFLSTIPGIGDTVSLDSTTVTRNNQPSHAFELQATLPIYDREHEIDFETRNPWGLLKSYYNFTAITPTPMVKGTWGYTQYHADSDSSFKFLPTSDSNWGDRISFSFIPGSQTRSINFRVEDNDKGREFYSELVNNFKTNNGSISFANSQGDVGVFTSLDKDATQLTLTENAATQYSVATLSLRLVFTTGGVDSIQLEVDGSIIPVDSWSSFQWEPYQEFTWPTINPSGIQLGIATITGQGPSYFTGEDVGHYSEKFGVPKYVGISTDNTKSTDWGNPDDATVGSGYQSMGYTVTDGRAENPDRLVENAWKNNVQKWMEYSRDYSDEQTADVENLNDRMDNLAASEVLHNVAGNFLSDTEVDMINVSIPEPDFRSGAPDTLSFLRYDPDQVFDVQTQQSGDQDDYNNTLIQDNAPIQYSPIEKTVLLSHTLNRVPKDLTKYNPRTGGMQDASESRDDYIFRPAFEGITSSETGENTYEYSSQVQSNKLYVYKRRKMSTDISAEPETYLHATLDANDYWEYAFPENFEMQLPVRGVSGWVQRGNKVYFTVSWQDWAPYIMYANFFDSAFESPFDNRVDLYEWDLDTDTQTMLHRWVVPDIPQTWDSWSDILWSNQATGIYVSEIEGCVYFIYHKAVPEDGDLTEQNICMYNLEYGTSSIQVLQRVNTGDGTAVGGWPNFNYWYRAWAWPLIGLPEPSILIGAMTDNYQVTNTYLGLRKATINTGGDGVAPSVLALSDWVFQDSSSAAFQAYPGDNEYNPPQFTGDIEYDGTFGRFFLTFGWEPTTDNSGEVPNTWIGNTQAVPFLLQGKFDFSQIFCFKIGNAALGAGGINFGAGDSAVGIQGLAIGSNGIALVPGAWIYYVSLTGFSNGSSDKLSSIVVCDQNFSILRIIESDEIGWDPTNLAPGVTDPITYFSPHATQQAGLFTINNPSYNNEGIYSAPALTGCFTQLFSSAYNHRMMRTSLVAPVDTSGVTGTAASATLTQTLGSTSWVSGDASSMVVYYDKNSSGKVALAGSESVSMPFVQGDSLDVILEGWWDGTGYYSKFSETVYSAGFGPKVSFYSDLSEIDGQTVEFILDLLFAQISVGQDTSYEFLGGEVSLDSFDNHVIDLAGGDPSYLEENATLVANTPYTVNHTLGEKLVVVEVYTYPGGVTHDCDVILVDNNSLTLTSSTNATVSIFVKA